MRTPRIEKAKPQTINGELRTRPRRYSRRPSWASLTLAGMVVVSALVRFLSALPHRTISYYPDEYIYPTLARSFMTTGHFTIRGANAHFPALLESIVTAPLWLGSNIELSMRLVQALHAIIMSLAAVPLYLLARRLGLERWQALVSAAFLLVLPDFAFATYLTADALAFTLTLTAIWLAIVVLESPTSLGQVAFLVLSLLATFARLEYVVLPVAFMVAAFAASGRRAPRRYPIAIGIPLLMLLLALVVGTQRLLGYYSGVTRDHVSVLRILAWMGTDSALLAFVAGMALIPGALAGLGVMLIRPRFVRERAFAAFYVTFALGLLVEAGLYATNGSDRFQERYVFVLLPFVPIAFFYLVQLKRKTFIAPLAVAAAVVIYTSIEPLTVHSGVGGSLDSPFFTGYATIERDMGVANAALLFALAAGAFALIGATVTLRRKSIWPVLAVSLLFPSTISALATRNNASSDTKVARTYLQRDFGWIDHAGFGDVALIVLKDSPRPQAIENLFWNRSLKRVYMVHNPAPFDSFPTYGLHIGANGELLTGNGSSIDTPFVVEEYADRVQIDDAKLIKRALTNSFWRPTGVPRFASLTEGLYFDGWLNQETTTTVWPPKDRENRGVYILRIGLPASSEASTKLSFVAPHFRRTIALHPGAFTTVRIPFNVRGPWRVHILADGLFGLADGRFVSGFAPHPPDVLRQSRK